MQKMMLPLQKTHPQSRLNFQMQERLYTHLKHGADVPPPQETEMQKCGYLENSFLLLRKEVFLNIRHQMQDGI